MTEPSGFLHFHFLRLDPSFARLQTNEKVVARQEVLSALESARPSPALAFSLAGMRADCDMMLARSCADLEPLEEAAQRLRSIGLGRFLVPAHDFLARDAGPGAAAPPGRDPAPPDLGEGRILFVVFDSRPRAALSRILEVLGRRPGLRWRSWDCLGPGGAGTLAACATDRPGEFYDAILRDPAPEGGGLSGPVFPCVRKDPRDLVEAMG